ncbi:hypothetical protein GCM10023403_40410 [Pseudonocardia benzenivorans]|uniref:Uncharacterized protein n=2 Tax=Pseudonocardia TaxID=1847 RepID=F4CQ40_PSEUX|nr:hypothetical protein Psed_5099 [Pseudonocardia dioxanivorans CB1190]
MDGRLPGTVRDMNDATVPLPAVSRRQSSPLGAIVLTWVVAAFVTLGVAAETRIGPVIMKFTPKHGIHLGDLATMLTCTAVALVVTAWLLSRPRH